MQITNIDTRKTPELSFLLGIDKEGGIKMEDSYMAAIYNDMREVLPELIEVNENEADVGRAVAVIGLCAATFKKIIDELSE